MRRRDLILGGAAALLACATLPTLALTPAQQLVLFSAKPLYTGPGDIVSGWTAWYGLRAYNAAVCGTGAQKAVNVRRNTDNATQDILILPSTCGVDTASATTFAGTYSATGTIASTVWTVTAVSGTPITAGDTISGTGVTAGSTVVSNGTGTGGTGTYNLNVASTVSVGEPMNATHGLFIAKVYDQSGNGHDIPQATAANQPQLFLSGGSSAILPYLQVSNNANQGFLGSNFTPATGVVTLFVIANRVSGTGVVLLISENGPNNIFKTRSAIANFWTLGSLNAAANDNAWHAGIGIYNGASGTIFIDGVKTTGAASGNTSTATIRFLNGIASTTANGAEGGFLDNVALSDATSQALTANARAYYGF